MPLSILQFHHRRLVVGDEAMESVMQLARRAANSNSSVLLGGESGTGKELIARFIHEHGKRAKQPFVSVNCAAVPEGLMESELFGHERGAFTGAVGLRIGKFERAQGGTILLDEVSEMSVNLQAKLLRVLQENEIERLGGKDAIRTDCRVIATTNRDPQKSILEGSFREDLYFRLNVVFIECPALRGRTEAIKNLAAEFLNQACQRQEKTIGGISDSLMTELINYSWPGNVRELQNKIERAVLLCDENCLELKHLGPMEHRIAKVEGLNGSNLANLEKGHILQTLSCASGNRTETAKALGISIRTLRNKLNSYQNR